MFLEIHFLDFSEIVKELKGRLCLLQTAGCWENKVKDPEEMQLVGKDVFEHTVALTILTLRLTQ